MSNNLVIALNIVSRIIGGVAIVGMGTYLIIEHHPSAGGFTIIFGFLVAQIDYDSCDQEEDSDA